MTPTRDIAVQVPDVRKLPAKLSTKARRMAQVFGDDLPSHMWSFLDDAALAALLERMADALAKAPKGGFWFWHYKEPATGSLHMLVQAKSQPFLSDTVALAARRFGTVMGIAQPPHTANAGRSDTLVYVALDMPPTTDLAALKQAVRSGVVLAQAAVDDFPATVAKLQERMAAHPLASEEETAFLNWLLAGNFIFLGYRCYDFSAKGKALSVKAHKGSGLGILREKLAPSAVDAATEVDKLGGSLVRYIDDGGWLQLSKSPDTSQVHRPVAMDYVGLLERDSKGNLLREHRFLGLYTSQAYTSNVRDIPLVRARIAEVIARAPWPAGGDNHRTLVNVLETFPRDELFMVSTAELLQLAVATVHARKQADDTTVMMRASPREQAVSVYMLAPMARYNSFVRDRVRALLMERLDGLNSEYKVEMADGVLARMLFKIRTATMPDAATEQRLMDDVRRLVRGWSDRVKLALFEQLGAAQGQKVWHMVREAIASAAYQERTGEDDAVGDLMAVHHLAAGEDGDSHVRLCGTAVRVVTRGRMLTLGDMMPVLRSFGLNVLSEQTFSLSSNGEAYCLHVFAFNPDEHAAALAHAEVLGRGIREALAGIRVVDSLNTLTQHGLPLDATCVLRALTAYMQQVNQRFSPGAVRKVLRSYPALASHLWEMFCAAHHPDNDLKTRSAKMTALQRRLPPLLAALPDADSDRIGRALVDVLAACLRTNFWQGEGAALAFKFDSSRIAALPQPRPWREIFVFAMEVEGIHLRGGPVARGGIRHSDRMSDYRTEVLALQTAQMRKNTIIVPEGAKGGFVVKAALPDDRGAAQELVRGCYRRYINALLSVTDTRAGAKVVPPRKVVRHDGDDPYLVVAADKGTATFSDLANQTAEEARFWPLPKGHQPQGFWLGDAFASGGKHGYDHKAMGITARGAWVSVEHHLKALDIAPSARRPLTMAGIGDMGGDVFGNGLLLCEHAALVAAFNHKHIFLDPTPDPKAAYAERKRLFKQVAGWEAYDATKISKGGGVFLRSAKSITLSKQVQALLGLKKAEATPAEVVQAILRAEVDVLWNGGIGTYIKAGHESHADAADRANDEVRVNAAEVRAKVIGEGGNLGITPDGRVELALRGVRLNSDAVDNSAGVSASDHEVNLKILFSEAKRAGKLSEPQRLKLLPALTDAVAALVLDDNGLQNLALSAEEAGDATYHKELLGWQQEMLKRGHLHPDVDTLPTAEALRQRHRHAYVRPELASMLAGTKAALRAQIAGKLDYDGPLMRQLLHAYFPAEVERTFSQLIDYHPLAHEITDTMVTNMVVNRCGLLMGQHLQTDFACTPEDAVKAILVAIGLVGAPELWHRFDAAMPKLSLHTQLAIYQRLRTVIATQAGWVLSHGQPIDHKLWLERLQGTSLGLMERLDQLLPAQARKDVSAWQDDWRNQGVPATLAKQMALLSAASMVPHVLLLAEETKRKPAEVMKLYLAVGESLMLPAVTARIRTMQVADRWTRPALQAMVREVMARQTRLTALLLKRKTTTDSWLRVCGGKCQRYNMLARELVRAREPTIGMLTVLLGRLRELEE
ncbi:MAG: NAD-glutamate dehydrogenase [Pseudomonadaceae bacterium]|nr:NAD-glutamate dehydrogenase [Pseudomonadaceae bacterium]